MPSSRPLSVIFNTYPVAFSCPGGGEIQLLRCREALARLGVDVILHDQWNPAFARADIVHHFSVMPGSWTFCWHVKQLGLPLVISPIIWPRENRQMYAWEEIRRLLHLCDKALPNSRAEADLLAELFELPPGKCVPIVNGVDEIFFEPVSPKLFREHYGLRRPFIFCAGNIEARKNQLTLIRACQGLGLDIVLAGNIREPGYWEQCRAEAGAEQVKYVGSLEHGGVLLRSAYAACAVFVLPSTLETPGLAALEAAACGCRLVITNEGCAEEYFGFQAAYVRHDDATGLRAAVEQALARQPDPGLPLFIKERYTWQAAAKQLLAAYESCLGTNLSNSARKER